MMPLLLRTLICCLTAFERRAVAMLRAVVFIVYLRLCHHVSFHYAAIRHAAVFATLPRARYADDFAAATLMP